MDLTKFDLSIFSEEKKNSFIKGLMSNIKPSDAVKLLDKRMSLDVRNLIASVVN